MRNRSMKVQLGFAGTLVTVLAAWGASGSLAQTKDAGVDAVAVEEVGLFEAIADRQVEVKFIPLSSDRANVIVANRTLQPLHVRLPATFAGVPVLGQFGGGPPGFGQGGGQGIGGGQFAGGGLGGGQFGGGGGGQNGGQALGGGFNQNGGAGIGGGGNGFGLQNGGGRGNGLFRVEPGRPTKISVQTVCLEHGKTDPNPRMKYQLVPLASTNSRPEIEVLCQQLAAGEVSQNVAQAAAWHLANGLSWEQLAQQNRRESNYTGNERYFSSEELQQSLKFTAYCRGLANRYVTFGSNESLATTKE